MKQDLLPDAGLITHGANQMSRRRLLQLMGTGAAGIAGASILASCWGFGNNPQPPSNGPLSHVTANMGATRQMVPYFLGYNNVPMRSPSWTDPNVIKVAQQLKAGTLRYPGGTIANFWDWQSGQPVPNAPFSNCSVYRLQELQTAVQATGAKPIFVLNMVTSTLDDQLQMLSTAKSMGLPLQYVELGNEFYIKEQSPRYSALFPTGRRYGTVSTNWINAIRQQFPDVKIAVVGSSPASVNGDPRKAQWDDTMLQTLQGADAVTFHPYVPINADQISSADATDGVSKLEDTISSKWQQYENQLQALPSNVKVWLTEYNLVNADHVFRTWIHGIAAANMTLTYLAEDRIELVCYFDMLGKVGDEAVFYDRAQSGNDPLPPYTFTASGWTLRLLGETLQGMNSAQQLAFASSSNTPSGLTGWLFTDGSRKQAFVINSAPDGVIWDIDAPFTQAQYQQLTCNDPFKVITGADSLTSNNGTAGDHLTLPAYSVTQLKLG